MCPYAWNVQSFFPLLLEIQDKFRFSKTCSTCLHNWQSIVDIQPYDVDVLMSYSVLSKIVSQRCNYVSKQLRKGSLLIEKCVNMVYSRNQGFLRTSKVSKMQCFLCHDQALGSTSTFITISGWEPFLYIFNLTLLQVELLPALTLWVKYNPFGHTDFFF